MLFCTVQFYVASFRGMYRNTVLCSTVLLCYAVNYSDVQFRFLSLQSKAFMQYHAVLCVTEKCGVIKHITVVSIIVELMQCSEV